MAITLVKPLLHEEMGDRHRQGDRYGHQDLGAGKVFGDRHVQQLGRDVGVAGARAQIERTAGTDHHGGREWADPGLQQDRVERDEQQHGQPGRARDHQVQGLPYDERQGQDEIRLVDELQWLGTGLDQTVGGTNLAHVGGEAGRGHGDHADGRGALRHDGAEGPEQVEEGGSRRTEFILCPHKVGNAALGEYDAHGQHQQAGNRQGGMSLIVLYDHIHRYKNDGHSHISNHGQLSHLTE
ncbi:hypothetical protein D3C72_983840 [compost metagenome]